MDDFITKPVSAEALFSALRRWIDTPIGDTGAGQERSAVDSGDVLDMEILGHLRELDPDGSNGFIAEVVQTFAADGRTRIDALQEAVARGDTARVKELAHALKGSAANLGARAVRSLTDELETMATGDTLDGVDGLVDRIGAEFERACAALRAEAH
jgi:HPt (histidine-containing phosphotransfer) domain-containing protein